MTRREDRIYYEELFKSLPLKFILSGLSDYELQLLLLRRVDELSPAEISPIVHRDVCQVRYDLVKLEAKIRYRVRLFLEQGGRNPF